MSKKIRLGFIGVGDMGRNHAVSAALSKAIEITAICDIDHQAADEIAARYAVPAFYDAQKMLDSGLVDAIFIGTPHYAHTTNAIMAFNRGIHVLTDKPVAAQLRDAQRMCEAAERAQKKFAVMFQQRTSLAHRALKKLLDSGELGKIKRIQWNVTDWFRTQAYYESSSWRATWKGEGGGVLLNQCPHQLDLFQWFFGMPERIHAFCKLGKYHKIEVEDEVTSYMEFANGVSAVFVSSTGELPGVNRLEIATERGMVTLENGKIHFRRTTSDVSEVCLTSKEYMPQANCWEIDIPVPNRAFSATEIFDDFAHSIVTDSEPLIPGAEAMKSLEIGNAMLLSTLLQKSIEIPLDADLYEQELLKLGGCRCDLE